MDRSKSCTSCGSNNSKVFTHYETKNNGVRELLKCNDCKHLYAEGVSLTNSRKAKSTSVNL